MNTCFRQVSLTFQPASEAERVFLLMGRAYLACIASAENYGGAMRLTPWAVKALTTITPFVGAEECVEKLRVLLGEVE